MTIDTNNLLESILESISRIDYVKSSDIPNIDLYMDQVTTFMEEQLKSSKRYPDDKILTKTMINNYAKNDLLPPPVKKKYNKEHLLILTFIYYFKNILSIRDIEKMLKPITDRYFQTEDSFNLPKIYDEVCSFDKERTLHLQEELQTLYDHSRTTFQQAPEEVRDTFQHFSFICALSMDVYVKKQIIEKLIDSLPETDSKNSKRKSKS